MARLSRARGIYCSPENWKKIGRRARKAGMSLSSFGILCCKQAAERELIPPLAPAGYPLVLSEEEQRRLRVNIEAHARSCRVAVREPGGAKTTVRLAEVLAILRICDCGDGA